MNESRIWAVALALALAAPALAQDRNAVDERIRRARERQAAQAAPAPAPQRQGQAQGQATQGRPLTEEQRSALGAVHAHNELATRVGELAASRGASQQVREFGSKIAQDHRHIDGELAALVKARGAELGALPTPPAGSELQRVQAKEAELSGKNGEELDRAFLAFFAENGNTFVDTLKRARDVTPGQDPELKKWLDDAENLAEHYRDRSRERRQARTPPAR